MISKRKQVKYLINYVAFNDGDYSPKEFSIINLKTNDTTRCYFTQRKNEKEYKKSIKELVAYTKGLDYPCFEPITVRIDVNGKIYSGSIVMRDYETNLEYLEQKYEENLKK